MSVCQQNRNKGIKIFKNEDPDILWVKLNRLLFNFEKDLYICFNYISPKILHITRN